MTEQNLHRVARAILVLATASLVGVLGVGVFRGELRGKAGSPGFLHAADFLSSGDLFDANQERGLLIVTDGGRRLLTVSVPGGEVRGEVDLPGRAASIVPTPGGVSVWVTFAERGEIEVYSTTDLRHQATILPDGGDGNIPVSLTFSENGDTLFVTWRGSGLISIYRHEMRKLTLMREIAAADAVNTAGPVIRNRRATRLYRIETGGGLATFFAQNGQRLDSIQIPGTRLQQSAPPVFTADYTAAWAVTETGELVGIDEAEGSAELSELGFDPALGRAPVLVGEEPRGLFVRSDERGVHRVDLFDIENPVESGSVELASVDVTGRIVSAVAAGTGAALLLTTGGTLVTVDGRSLAVVETAEIRTEGAPIRPVQAAAWAIDEEGNFACF